MPLPFRTFVLREAITPKDFDQLQREAQMFTKNIRRIKNGDELRAVVRAYMKWHEHLERFVYVRLLGVNATTMHDLKGWTNNKHWERVAKRMENEPLAMFELRKRMLKMATEAAKAISMDQWRSVDDPNRDWDSIYQWFDQYRSNQYNVFSRCVRELFKALDQYRDSRYGQEGTFPEHYVEEYVEVEGFKVKLVYSEYRGGSNFQVLNNVPHWKTDAPDALHRSLRIVQQSIQHIKQKGFGFALGNRLNFELLPTSHSSHTFEIDALPGTRLGTAGLYHSHRQLVQVFYSGLTDLQTTVHEIGHHVFRTVFNNQQRLGWTDFVTRNQISFTDDDLMNLRTAFGRTIPRMGADNSRADFFRMMAVNLRQESESAHQKFLHFINAHKANDGSYGINNRSRVGYFEFVNPTDDKQNDRAWAQFRAQASQPFMLSAPTTYSNSNPEEAFCETFSYYVTNTPLDPIVKTTFLGICRETF